MTSYEDAGVSLARGDAANADAFEQMSKTWDDSIVLDCGIPGKRLRALYPELKEDIIETLAVDGVGTKLIYAAAADLLESVGEDLVAMVVDDVPRYYRRPVAFASYRGRNQITHEAFQRILSGVVSGCNKAGIPYAPYLGGETAEMPDFYVGGNFEIVGFATCHHVFGKLRRGQDTQIGDVLLALPSNGGGSNGFSGFRKYWSPEDVLAGKCSVDIYEILKPTPIYNQALLAAMDACSSIRGWAHITGGGLGEHGKLAALLPPRMQAVLYQKNWEVPRIFREFQKVSLWTDQSMYDAYNMGLMMVAPIHPNELLHAWKILEQGFHCEPLIVGEVRARDSDNKVVII